MTTTYGAAIVFLIIALMFGVAYFLLKGRRTASTLLKTSVTFGVCGLVIIAIGFLPFR
jgi:hypothetical protein